MLTGFKPLCVPHFIGGEGVLSHTQQSSGLIPEVPGMEPRKKEHNLISFVIIYQQAVGEMQNSKFACLCHGDAAAMGQSARPFPRAALCQTKPKLCQASEPQRLAADEGYSTCHSQSVLEKRAEHSCQLQPYKPGDGEPARAKAFSVQHSRHIPDMGTLQT